MLTIGYHSKKIRSLITVAVKLVTNSHAKNISHTQSPPQQYIPAKSYAKIAL